MEIWRSISGFEQYFISNTGQVKGIAVKILKPSISKGYYNVHLYKNGIKKQITIHLLVATTFIGNKPLGLTINHKDGNKLNNNLSNLEYVTQKQNNAHAWALGLIKSKSSLTQHQIIHLRADHENFKQSLSIKYKISIQSVNNILKWKSWKYT